MRRRGSGGDRRARRCWSWFIFLEVLVLIPAHHENGDAGDQKEEASAPEGNHRSTESFGFHRYIP